MVASQFLLSKLISRIDCGKMLLLAFYSMRKITLEVYLLSLIREMLSKNHQKCHCFVIIWIDFDQEKLNHCPFNMNMSMNSSSFSLSPQRRRESERTNQCTEHKNILKCNSNKQTIRIVTMVCVVTRFFFCLLGFCEELFQNCSTFCFDCLFLIGWLYMLATLKAIAKNVSWCTLH